MTLREKLAEHAHKEWAGWVNYMFSKGDFKSRMQKSRDKTYWLSFWMPRSLYNRWMRQVSTQYDDLPPSERESDREAADRWMDLIARHMWGDKELEEMFAEVLFKQWKEWVKIIISTPGQRDLLRAGEVDRPFEMPKSVLGMLRCSEFDKLPDSDQLTFVQAVEPIRMAIHQWFGVQKGKSDANGERE